VELITDGGEDLVAAGEPETDEDSVQSLAADALLRHGPVEVGLGQNAALEEEGADGHVNSLYERSRKAKGAITRGCEAERTREEAHKQGREEGGKRRSRLV
jgi:hypothetical protein